MTDVLKRLRGTGDYCLDECASCAVAMLDAATKIESLTARLAEAEAGHKAQEEEAARTHDAWGEEVNAYAARIAEAEKAARWCYLQMWNDDRETALERWPWLAKEEPHAH
jgi:hypothetical protein